MPIAGSDRVAQNISSQGPVMTANNLMVLMPWAVFSVGLAAVCLRLLRLRRTARRGSSPPLPQRPPRQAAADDAPEAAPRPARQPTRREHHGGKALNGTAETAIAVVAGLAAAYSFGVGVALRHLVPADALAHSALSLCHPPISRV